MMTVSVFVVSMAVACWPNISLAQNGPTAAIEARCASENFQDADRAACVDKQWDAIGRMGPVASFIQDGGFLLQTLALGRCVERSKDYFGHNAAAVMECYDDAIEAGCQGNSTCLANGSVAGIEIHIKNGTKP